MHARMKAAAVALALTVAAVLLVATPASASGGGCATKSNNGFVASACSSDNGTRLWADVYVDQVNPARLTGCYVYSYVVDGFNGYVGYKRWYPCAVGHYGPSSQDGVHGHWYTHHVELWANSQQYLHAVAPFSSF
jgi:hypothetical protein